MKVKVVSRNEQGKVTHDFIGHVIGETTSFYKVAEHLSNDGNIGEMFSKNSLRCTCEIVSQ